MGLVEVVVAHLSWQTALAWTVGIWFAVFWLRRASELYRMRKTGGVRAPERHGWFPFGLDLVVATARANAANRNMEQWQELFRSLQGHTIESRVLNQRVIYTDDPDNIKAILATQFGDYGKGKDFHTEWVEFLGDSIFTTDGPKWHASRQMLRPQFVKDRVSDLDTFETHLHTLFTAMTVGGDAGRAAEALRQQKTTTTTTTTSSHSPLYSDTPKVNGQVLDMADLFFRYTLDVATDFLLGKDTQSLTTPRAEFALAFNEVQRIQGFISRTGPANFLVPRGSYRKGLRVIEDFVNIFIERALRLPPEELEKTSDSNKRYTFLHELARFTRDRTVLREQILAVLLAGRDTTAATLSWAIYELGRHPHVVTKLRSEIRAFVGVESDEKEKKNHCRPPTYADLKNMKYLQHVLNETLRLYPAVPFNVRRALKDTTLPRGGGPDRSQPVAVLEGTPIGYSTLCMQRRPDLYAADQPGSNDFVPERWEHWQPKPWQYIPFNGGPRICLGQQFALTEMGYVLVRFFQKFERVVSHMEPIDGGHPALRADIVLQPHDGVKVAFYGGE